MNDNLRKSLVARSISAATTSIDVAMELSAKPSFTVELLDRARALLDIVQRADLEEMALTVGVNREDEL